MGVVLRAYTEADLDLALALETDPVVMAELGGPRDEAAVRDVHVRRLAERYWLVIADADSGEALGTIGAWEIEHDGETIHETGWTVLPHAHGRGVGSAALGLLLERLRADPAVERLHAFPGVTNVASNRLCDRHGFLRLEVAEFEYAGRTLRCNHRVLDLMGSPGLEPGTSCL